MAGTNLVRQMKELIAKIKEADEAYFVNDAPIMSDREYDELVRELKSIEQETGIVFSDSPTKKVGGDVGFDFQEVEHTKPMLSAQKTKNTEDIAIFRDIKGEKRDTVVSWKLDGLTLVLRYSDGEFKQAITRGRDGIVGEDVTHTVKHLRNIPLKVPCKDNFEVRGEGVCSWKDFEIIKKSENASHPRNTAAGAVRSKTADEGKLSHIDFIAFELIMPHDISKKKTEQFNFMYDNNFDVVECEFCSADDDIKEFLKHFKPECYKYPVDGIIIEVNDIALGRNLGATAHHENRMIALKWEDEVYETVFRGVEMTTTRSGIVEINAMFDPVEIQGSVIHRANVHGVSGFEKLQLGVGDIIRVYKANMIVPQISENITRSGTFELSKFCPCCGTRLDEKVSAGGTRNLYCGNDECLAKNAQKLARFCDKNAMNIDGLSTNTLQALMEHGFIKTYVDIYHLSEKKNALLNTKGLRLGNLDALFERIENSRKTNLTRFLQAVDIPRLGYEAAKHIDEYFYQSFKKFEESLKKGFDFSNIEGVSYALNENIYNWYDNQALREQWEPLLGELAFRGDKRIYKNLGNDESTLAGKNIAIVGVNDPVSLAFIAAELSKFGINITATATPDTDFLLVSFKG